MNYKNKVNDLKDLLNRKKALEGSINQKKSEILSCQSHAKVGDTLETNGWAHSGKSFVVDDISFSDRYDRNKKIVASGFIIKKDGSAGVMRGIREYEIIA
jgi:hypothetical protein